MDLGKTRAVSQTHAPELDYSSQTSKRRSCLTITVEETPDVLYPTAGNVSDVSILINSGTRVNSDLAANRGGQGPAQTVFEQSGRDDDNRTGRSSVSRHVPVVPRGGSLESRVPHVRREDLSASALDSLAQAEITPFPRRVNVPPTTGQYSERGLTDQPPSQDGALLTQVLPSNRSLREPVIRYEVVSEGEEPLPRPHLSKPPEQSVEERGGVVDSLVWEVEEEVDAAKAGSPTNLNQHQGQTLSREMILQQELAHVVEEEVSLAEVFSKMAARADQLASQKTAILDQLYPGAMQIRELLLRARKDG